MEIRWIMAQASTIPMIGNGAAVSGKPWKTGSSALNTQHERYIYPAGTGRLLFDITAVF